MPSLYDYLRTIIEGAGYDLGDIVEIQYDDGADRIDLEPLSVNMASFVSAAQQVEAGDVAVDQRHRFRFVVEKDNTRSTFVWSDEAGGFVLYDSRPLAFTVTPALLRGEE